MTTKLIYFYIILFLVTQITYSVKYKKYPQCHNCGINPISIHLPSKNCCYHTKSTKFVINAYKNVEKQQFLPPKILNSVFIKCWICLAVAEQVSRIIKNVINKVGRKTHYLLTYTFLKLQVKNVFANSTECDTCADPRIAKEIIGTALRSLCITYFKR